MRTFIFGILAFFFALSTQTALAADQVGTVVRIQAFAEAVTMTKRRTLEVDAPIYKNDLLVTGSGARLKVALIDETSLTLGEEAELTVAELDMTPGQESAGLELIRGAFLVVTGAVAKAAPDRYRVKTPYATIGIRGTTFWGGPLDDPFSVLLLDGEIEVRNPGGSVILKPNQGTDIGAPDQAPEAPGAWSDDKRTRAFATITFNGN